MAAGDDIVVLGGGLTKFARERSDGTPTDWMVEAALDGIKDAGVDFISTKKAEPVN